MDSREYAADLFRRALARVDVAEAIRAQTSCTANRLVIAQLEYPLTSFRRIVIVAVGKAAVPMASTFLETLAPFSESGRPIQGVVVSGSVPDRQQPPLRYYIAGHPIPNRASRSAAEEILAELRRCTAHDLVLFLISGGASAQIELPLWPEIPVDETASFYRQIVHSGLSITEMNCLRKHFSAIKGGRLANAAAQATQCTVLVSDVPEGALDVIGSGPSMPDTSTVDDCRRILHTNGLLERLTPRVKQLLTSPELPETEKPGSPAFANASFVCLLSNKDLLREAALLAEADGYHTAIDNTCDDWDYKRAADYLIRRTLQLRTLHPHVCLLSGGEISVPLPPVHGRGGRNQHFALFSAMRLAEERLPLTILSAGTDGLDGNSPAAGAVVDEHTVGQLRERGRKSRATPSRASTRIPLLLSQTQPS